jgi:hypothetical protein
MDSRENTVPHFVYSYEHDYWLGENQGLRGMNERRLQKRNINKVPLGYNDSLPFKQNHVYSIVAFTQNISKDASGVATPYLIG